MDDIFIKMIKNFAYICFLLRVLSFTLGIFLVDKTPIRIFFLCIYFFLASKGVVLEIRGADSLKFTLLTILGLGTLLSFVWITLAYRANNEVEIQAIFFIIAMVFLTINFMILHETIACYMHERRSWSFMAYFYFSKAVTTAYPDYPFTRLDIYLAVDIATVGLIVVGYLGIVFLEWAIMLIISYLTKPKQ
jgi:hypothetical protein